MLPFSTIPWQPQTPAPPINLPKLDAQFHHYSTAQRPLSPSSLQSSLRELAGNVVCTLVSTEELEVVFIREGDDNSTVFFEGVGH